jgi:DNA-binding XRE family transcriptional regulator
MTLERRGRPRSTWTWTGKLGAFVSSYRIENLADAVEVDAASVYRWMRGDSSPSVANAIAIVELARAAGTPLTLEDVFQTEVNTIRVRMRMRSSLT